jgi:glycosyltransferase involved in cell wall biosynthesis
MTADRLVSLVMPAWRPDPAWLRLAVASALGQRGCRLELIVVDDGCPEPVGELLADVRDPRLRIVRIEHGGACAARNAGLSVARGELVRFADSDDVFDPSSTARLLALIGGRDDVIAYGDTTFCDAALRPVWTMRCRLEGDVREDCLLGRLTVRPQSILFPRSVIERAGAWDERIRIPHDWDLILRALEHATARCDPRTATLYRRHGDSVTSNVESAERDVALIVEGYFERHPEQRGTRLKREVEARRRALLARVWLTHRRPARGVGHALRALALDPRGLVEEAGRGVAALRGRARYALNA